MYDDPTYSNVLCAVKEGHVAKIRNYFASTDVDSPEMTEAMKQACARYNNALAVLNLFKKRLGDDVVEEQLTYHSVCRRFTDLTAEGDLDKLKAFLTENRIDLYRHFGVEEFVHPDTYRKYRSILSFALEYGSQEIIEYFLTDAYLHRFVLPGAENPARVYAILSDALDRALCSAYHPEMRGLALSQTAVISTLLEYLDDKTIAEHAGRLLHYAILRNEVPLINLCIKAVQSYNIPLNINVIRDADSNNLFHFAAMEGSREITDLLFPYGDVTACNNNGEPPFYYAVKNGHTELTEYFLQKGGVPPAADWADNYNEWTWQHLACVHGRKDIYDLLVKYEPSRSDRWGLSPLDYLNAYKQKKR